MPETEERLEDLLASARVSRAQLHRWQQAGLVPKPRQRGLGRGEGSETLYPPGTARQLATLQDALNQERSLEGARWRLWWMGYPVHERYIVPLLERQLTDIERGRDVLRRLKDDDSEASDAAFNAIDRWAHGRLAYQPLRRTRKRTGKKRFASFVFRLNELATGTLTEWSEQDDEPLFAAGLGLARSAAYREHTRGWALLGQVMQGLAPALHPEALRVALTDVETGELRQARDELRRMLGLVDQLRKLLEAWLGSGMTDRALVSGEMPLVNQRYALLVWLSARRLRPVWYKRFKRWARVAEKLSINASEGESDHARTAR